MNKLIRPIGVGAALVSLLALTAAEAQAQRRGGGGAGIRSSASGSINHAGRGGGTRDFNRGGGSTRDLNRGGSTSDYNRGTRDVNRNTTNRNVSRDYNRTDVNVRRDVDIDVDVDHDWGCCGNNWGGFYAGAVVGATAAAAWRRGAYYSTLPSSCVTVYRGTVVYYQCGSYWYQPVYSGMTLSYVAIDAP